MVELDNETFICACYNVEHQLIFTSSDGDVFMSIHLVPERNIFKRIWYAIKYIFGYKCRYGHFDEFIFQRKDAYKLARILNYLTE